MRFVPHISWTSSVRLFLGETFRQRAANCWAVALVRNLQFVLKMRNNILSILSIQELMNSMPRRCYDEDGVVHPVLSEVDGVLDEYVLANHFLASGTVYEEDCPITEEHVYLDESRITEGCVRIIPSICEVHSAYDYVDKYGAENGATLFCQQLEKHLRKGPLSIRFAVYPSYSTTQGKLYSPSDAELELGPRGAHCVLATALGTVDDDVWALECQDSRGPTWGSSGYIYVAMDMVPLFYVIR